MGKVVVFLISIALVFSSGCRRAEEPPFAQSVQNERNRVAHKLEPLRHFYYYTSKSAGMGMEISYYHGQKQSFGIDVEKSILHRSGEIILERDLFYSGKRVENDWQSGRDDGPVFERAWHQCVYDMEAAKSAHAFVEKDGDGYYYSGVDQGRAKPISRSDFVHYIDGWRQACSKGD